MNDKLICLITGSSTGIGYHVVQQLANQQPNYKIYATSDDVSSLKERVPSDVTVRKLDVSNESDISDVVDEILREHGKVDVLVHCAHVNQVLPVEYADVEAIRSIINVNGIGLMSLTAKCLPHMQKKSSGHIIALSDMSGIIGFPFQCAYSASKFAVEGYCESIKEELKDYYIDVSLIETGPVICDGGVGKHYTTNNNQQDAASNGKPSELMKTFIENKEAVYHTIAQSAEAIAKQVVEIILNPDPKRLRYMTNYISANALSPIYKENQIEPS